MSAPTAVPAQQVVNFSWEAQPSVMDRARPDARAHDEMRELTFSATSFTRSDGSVRLSLGGTTVLAAVTGPIAADASREDPERAFVDVTVRLPVSGPGAQMTTYEMSIANTVASVFSAAIALDAYPRSKITITLHVLSDAGSLRAACINAATAAALDAALPCLFAPAAAEVALIDPRAGSASSGAAGEDEDDKANAKSGSNLSLVLDPHSAEEADALGRVLIVAAPAPATVLPPAHPDAPPAAVSAAAASTASAAAAASSDAVNGPALVAASKQMTVVSAVATGPWPPALWLSALSAATTACAFVAAKNRVRAGEAADARGVTVGAVEAAKKAAEAAAEQALTKMATKGQA